MPPSLDQTKLWYSAERTGLLHNYPEAEKTLLDFSHYKSVRVSTYFAYYCKC